MQSTSNASEAVEEVEVQDVEKAQGVRAAKPDIEHVEVQDDPRKWAPRKKWGTFFFICFTSMAAALSANIFLPAIDSLRSDLGASQEVVTLSVSLFVFFQGVVPILWSGISEIYGRKVVFTVAFTIFTISQAVCAGATDPILFLVFRVVGACGSSAGLAIGAGTLADIFEPEERGTKIGIYYTFPLIGPSLGALLGGALALTRLTWRSPFILTAAYGAICVVWSAFFFKDTFRQERSLAWIAAFKRAEEAAKAKDAARKAARTEEAGQQDCYDSGSPAKVPEEPVMATRPVLQSQMTGGQTLRKITTKTGEIVPVKTHLSDVNPLAAVGIVLRQPNCLLAVLASGLMFGAQYALAYTAALSFAAPPYNFNSLKVGLVLLCFGVGNIVGSVLGGRYSDILLARVRKQNDGKMIPEARLRATFIAMPLIPLSFLAYAWTVEERVPIYWPCIILFLQGLSVIWVYSATLTYLVDSSVGMASSAVSCNSAARGTFGFVAAQSAQPLLQAIGNGPLYSMWSGLLVVALLSLVLTWKRGQRWREKRAEKIEREKDSQERK